MATSKKQRPADAPLPRDALAARTLQTIQRYQMLAPGDRVLVAVSGGPDSVALLHLLHALAPRFDASLGVAHLDHGLRPEDAEEELALVRSLTRRLGLVCHTGKITRPSSRGSLEEQLRNLRYAFLQDTAAQHGYTKIALGHHADDNAEAVLLRLLRGSGIRGLAGIPPVRDGGIIRPMLHARRRDIMAYLECHKLNFAEDPSNTDPRFERNKVRHQLIPLLCEHFNANVVETLNRLSMLCREEDLWLSSYLRPLQDQAIRTCDRQCLELASDPLTTLPRPLQRRLIRDGLEKWQGHLRRLGADHIEAIIELAAGRAGRRLSLPGAILGLKADAGIRFTCHSDARRPPDGSDHEDYQYNITLQRIPFSLEISEARCRLTFSLLDNPTPPRAGPVGDTSIMLDFDQLHLPLIVRNRRPGDRLHPFGLTGTQKVKSLLIDRKMPVHQRDRIPLLLAGETILWVAGVRRGSAAQVSPQTQRILQVLLEPF